jgi:hypothetical protein
MARQYSHRARFCAFLAALTVSVVSANVSLYAQMTNVGRIAGSVTDLSGAVVSDATITVTNQATNQSWPATSDARGFYVVTNLPVGSYSASAEKQGFAKQLRTGYNLSADARLTVDFALRPGTVSETVEVAASGETVNTTSGEISRVISSQQVENLPLNGRNYSELVTLIPGVVVQDEDQMAITTSLTASPFSVNGIRNDQNMHTIDGGFNLDSGSNGSLINNIGVEFVQEVNVKTANFSADYGRAAGAAINVVTKSGGNSFHGGASWYLRNDHLDAVNYYSHDKLTGAAIKPKLRFNNPVWDFGGPIKRDKLFFFVGQQWKYLRSASAPASVTMPTTAELSGDFRDWKYGTLNLKKPTSGAPAGCTITNNVLSPQCITPDGLAVANLYKAMEAQAASFSNLGSGSNTIYQTAQPFDSREDLARIDYYITSKQWMYLRYVHDEFSIVLPTGFSCATDVPSCPEVRQRPGTSYQLAHTWTISPTLVNLAKVNVSWNGQRLIPVGDSWKRATYGFTFPQIFPSGGGRFRNSIPDINLTTFNAIRGQSHALLAPTTDIAPGDDLTWSHGQHTIKTGFVLVRNRKDQNSRSNYAGVVTFTSSSTAANSSGNALADALMGNFASYQEASDDPIGHFRFTQYQAYLTDTWKVLPRLSLEIGLRYQYAIPWYTQGNNLTNFDPSLYDPSKAVTVQLNGTIDTTKGGNPYNGLIRAGAGVPNDQLVRIPNGQSATVLAIPAGAPRGLYKPQSAVAPRFGFALQPFDSDKTSIRGGFGIFYDTPEGNMIFDEVGNPPWADSRTFQFGNLSNPSGGATPRAGTISLSAIDPHLKQSYSMSYSLSVERELPRSIFVEVAYVGDQARHLIRKPDINMPSLATLVANAALPSSQRATNIDALRPYKGYSSIGMFVSDATSNYNALQAYVAKRTGNLILTGSYTWSNDLTDSGGGNNDVRNSGNNDNIQDATMRHFNYGPAPFDRRHVFVATYSYTLPFFRAARGPAHQVLRGWEFSGSTRLQTGEPYTVTGTSTFAGFSFRRRADYLGGPIQIDAADAAQWFNSAAFTLAPDARLGTAGAGTVRGPSLYLWNFSFRKEFILHGENYRLQFRADMVNAFNHTNFRFSSTSALLANNTNISSGDYGHPTTAGPPRNIQLGLRFMF